MTIVARDDEHRVSGRRGAQTRLPGSFRVVAVGGILALALAGIGLGPGSPIASTFARGQAHSTERKAVRAASAHKIKHVFIIMLENTDWSTVKGSASAPFINHTLLPRFAHAENYHATHPSIPNYVTLEAGDDLGLTDGHFLPTDHNVRTHDHLTYYLQRAKYSWKYYGESLPGNGSECSISGGPTPYSDDHNPFVYFQDVSSTDAPKGYGEPSAASSYCRKHERPFSELARDLAHKRAQNYSFIVPNDYDNGDKPAPGSTCVLCQADTFLSHLVPTIQHSRAYKSGVIFVLWDEASHGSSGASGLIVVSPFAKKGYSNTVAYSHTSTLRTVERIFHLKPYIRGAASATDLSDLFKRGTL